MSVIKGIIVKGLGGQYTVAVENGDNFTCKARGVFRKNNLKPMIGDIVLIEDDVIIDIQDRKNTLIRPAVSNVDLLCLVLSAGSPKPDLLLADKLLINANANSIDAIIAISKEDQNENYARELADEYQNAVKGIYVTSSKDEAGLLELKEAMHDKITVLVGQSGAGKSSLLNALTGKKQMETGELSKKTEHGKHTTRHNELFKTDFGFVIDSPGFSVFEMQEIEAISLQKMYPELYNINGCFFQNCSHTGEPKCSISKVLEEGKMSIGRYERYKIFYRELLEKEKHKYK